MTSSSELSHSVPQQPSRSGLRIVVALTVVTIGAAILARSLLRNPDSWNKLDAVVSADAATALAILDDDSATESSRFIAASRLGKSGKEVVPALQERLRSDSPAVRKASLMALGQIRGGASPVLPLIAELSVSADESQMKSILDAVIRIDVDSEHTRSILRRAIQSKHKSIRREGVSILTTRTKTHDPLLIELLESPDAELRRRAISAFCTRNEPPAPEIVRRVEAAVFDADEKVRVAALGDLERHDLVSDELFEAIINGPHQELYARTIRRVLSHYGDNAFRDIGLIDVHAERLAEILRSDSSPVDARDAAMFALASTGYGDAEARDVSLHYTLSERNPGNAHWWDVNSRYWFYSLISLSGYGPRQELPLAEFLFAFRNESPGNPVFILQDHLVSSADLDAIAKLPALRVIGLFGCDLERGALKSLEAAPGLWALVLSDCSLTDDDLKSLPPLPVLTHLSLYQNPITSDSAAAIARQSQLRYLAVSETQLDDRSLDELSQLRHLQSVGFQDTGVAIQSLARIKSLQYLQLDEHLTDDDITQLCELRHLKYFQISGPKVSDASLPHLARLTNLQRLVLFHTHITQAGVDRLQSELPDGIVDVVR